MSVNKGAADREVQQALLDVTIEHGLSQVHDQPTRDNNLLDLEVIKLEFILGLKIKHNDWLLADTCPQAATRCALF